MDLLLLVIDPVLGAGLITGGATLLGGLLGFGSNKKSNSTNLAIARENNQAQMEMQREMNMFTKSRDMYQNWYNSPEQQRKRLEEAGYSPASLFGSNAIPAASSSVPSAPSLHSAEVKPFDPSPYLTLLGQNVASFAAAKKSMAEAKGLEIDNANKQELFKAQLDELVARKLLTDEQKNEVIQSIAFKDANWDNLTKQIESLTSKTFHDARNAAMEADILEVYGLPRANAEVKSILADAALKVEQGNTEGAKRALMKIQGDVAKAEVSINKMLAHSVMAVNYANANKTDLEKIALESFGVPKLAQEFLNTIAEGDLLEVEKWIAKSEKHVNLARRFLHNLTGLPIFDETSKKLKAGGGR